MTVLGLCLAVWLGGHAPPARATSAAAEASLRVGERDIQLTEVLGADGSLERRFTAAGLLLYRARVLPSATGFEVTVAAGHPAQLGRFVVDAGTLSAFDASGAPLWAQPLPERLCLPELFGEFVRAHWDRLVAGAEPLRCVTPILKARKVAPLQWRRLPDEADGRRVVEVAAGSLGMRLFMSPTRLTFSPDGSRLLAQAGQFEAPPRVDGRAGYLRGDASFTRSRESMAWPATRFAAAPSVADRSR